MDNINRKEFFKQMGALGIVAVSGSTLVSACGNAGESADKASASTEPAKKMDMDPCADLSGLTEQEVKGREALGYIAKSEKEGQLCTNCNFWQDPTGDSPCGGCQLMKGPIHPDGWCKSWFEKKG